MAPRRDPDDRASEGGDADSEEEESPRSRRSARRGRARPSGQRGPVRRWHEADEAEEGDEDPSPPRGRRWMLPREEHPVYWRARDSLYFEPLVAVAIIVLLLVGLYAYTQNWPPVYV
ncbi:MAG: hypothetical protein ACREDE_11440, partial [Thermoplasmata archaeon]